MLTNYLKIAWRDLIRHRLYSAIKIGGLAFSIAVCLLIALFIRHEVSYDRAYPDSERLYRAVISVNKRQSGLVKSVSFQAPFAPTMKANFPEIEKAGRMLSSPLFGAGSNQVSTEDNAQSLYEEGFAYADQELLDMLQLPFLYGAPQHALDEPATVILTASRAARYFPNANPLGKLIFLNNDKSKPYVIRGVLKDIPTNSHLHGYNFFLTLKGVNFYDGEQNNWLATNYTSYFKFRPGTDLKKLAGRMQENFINNYFVPQIKAAGRQPDESLKTARLFFQPLNEIHLYSQDFAGGFDVNAGGDIRIVWLFGGIAGFILLIACINFINLSTARSASRAKEIGIRKVVGSYRTALVRQFLLESMLYSFLSVMSGIAIAWILLPLFNHLAGKQLVFPWSDFGWVPVLGLTVVGVGILAGLYPAIFLSGFRPAQVLKGQLSQGTRNPLLRNGLVVFQFATSIILTVCTLVINNQMRFILDKKIGFDKEQVLIIQGTHTLGEKIGPLKDEIRKIADVTHVSVSDYLPVRADGTMRNGNPFWKAGKINEDAAAAGQYWQIDEDYIPTLGIRLSSGRNFDKTRTTDSGAVIINQSLADALNLAHPIGARITNGGEPMTVIGVVEDFHFESMREKIGGLCFILGKSPSMIAVKLSGRNSEKTIARISEVWKTLSPDQPIRFTFLDESYAAMYENVQRTGIIFSYFAVFAIMIASLGLFGLAAFTTAQRTREIGIRKVLGASISGIIRLLSQDFAKLVFLALLIASPIAWWGMSKWLQDFAYRTDIQWGSFALAGGAALAIAVLTVSSQAIKAALATPANTLRNE